MRFSIIIPVYQVERYIDCALSSVAAQTFPGWEAVIVDDGSTDRSGAICRSYCCGDERFKMIRQDNAGLSAARNTGIAAAAGDYILFLDGDDFLKPDALERLAAQIDRAPVDIVCFNGYVNVNELADGGAKEEWIRGNGLPFGETIPGYRMYEKLADNRDAVAVPMVWQRCYRRAFWEKNDLTFSPGRLHEDEEWTPRAFYFASTAVMLDYSGYCYRRRSGSITAVLKEKNLEHLALDIADLCRFFSQHSFPDAETARPFVKSLMALLVFFSFSSLNSGIDRVFAKFCRQHRVFSAVSALPYFHRMPMKTRLYLHLARIALTCPALYRLGKSLTRDR